MVGAVLCDLEGVLETLSPADARFFLSMAVREQSTAFCWRLRFCRRWVVPLLKTAAVILAMCAIVARGAVSVVSCARDAASISCAFAFEGAVAVADDKLIFSTNGVFEGEGVGEGCG